MIDENYNYKIIKEEKSNIYLLIQKKDDKVIDRRLISKFFGSFDNLNAFIEFYKSNVFLCVSKEVNNFRDLICSCDVLAKKKEM